MTLNKHGYKTYEEMISQFLEKLGQPIIVDLFDLKMPIIKTVTIVIAFWKTPGSF